MIIKKDIGMDEKGTHTQTAASFGGERKPIPLPASVRVMQVLKEHHRDGPWSHPELPGKDER